MPRRDPRLVNVLNRHVSQLGNVPLHVSTGRVETASVQRRREAFRAVEQTLKRGRAQPEPVPGIDAPIAVEKIRDEVLVAFFPSDPQRPAG